MACVLKFNTNTGMKEFEEPKEKKPRTLFQEHTRSESNSSSGDCSIPDGCIPDETSKWIGDTLPYLRVSIDTMAENPKEIFQRSYLSFLKEKTETLSGIFNFFKDTNNYLNIKQCFQDICQNVIDLDYNRLDELSVQKVLDLKNSVKSDSWRSEHKLPDNIIALGIQGNLKKFYGQLLYMKTIGKRNKYQELPEGMFQELFVRFTEIFGLEVYGGRNLPKFQFNIGDSKIKCEPDALVCNSEFPAFEKKHVIAVVKVKKHYSRDGEDPQTVIRKLGSAEKITRQVPHVHDCLKAQHVGEMLAVLPHSVFDVNGIFGFIVQGTNVTVVSFRPEEGYYEALTKGKMEKKKVFVQYSRECNFLSKEGRALLCDVFLDMGNLLEYLAKC